jgi:hypothetical protein
MHACTPTCGYLDYVTKDFARGFSLSSTALTTYHNTLILSLQVCMHSRVFLCLFIFTVVKSRNLHADFDFSGIDTAADRNTLILSLKVCIYGHKFLCVCMCASLH